MKRLMIGLLFLSQGAWACWQMQGEISFNQDSVKIDQKIEHDKTYSFQVGHHLVNLKVPSAISQENKKAKKRLIELEVFKKEGLNLTKLASSQLIVKEGQEAELTTQDNKTHDLTVMKFKLNHI